MVISELAIICAGIISYEVYNAFAIVSEFNSVNICANLVQSISLRMPYLEILNSIYISDFFDNHNSMEEFVFN